MGDLLGQFASFAGDVLWTCFGAVGGFVLSFFPDADAQVVGAISGWGDIGAVEAGFNFLYFLDWRVVALFLGMAVLVVFASLLFVVARLTVDLVHKVLDAIPFIG